MSRSCRHNITNTISSIVKPIIKLIKFVKYKQKQLVISFKKQAKKS